MRRKAKVSGGIDMPNLEQLHKIVVDNPSTKETRRCIKCGGTDMYVKYKVKGDKLNINIGDRTFVGVGYAEDECLYCYCKICNYDWIEDCEDKKTMDMLKDCQ